MDSRLQYLIPLTVENKKILENAVDVELLSHPFASYIIVKYNVDKKLLYIRKDLFSEKNLFNTKFDNNLFVVKFKIPKSFNIESKLSIEFGEQAFSKRGLLKAMNYWQQKR